MSACRPWPVHPRPEDDEILSSWMVRLARANGSQLGPLRATVEGRHVPRNNFDTVNDPRQWEWLAAGGALPGGAEAVRSLSLVDAIGVMGRRGAARWVLNIDARSMHPRHQWCPACLGESPVYFRRSWRLEWVWSCPKHDVVLRDACPGCGAHADWKRVSWRTPMSNCWRCGTSLAHARQNSSVLPGSVLHDAAREALDALAARQHDRFGAVWSLQKWVEAVPREQWSEFAAPDVSELVRRLPTTLGRRFDAALSFALAWSLSDRVEDLEPLVDRHRSRFHRATAYACPDRLAWLRRVSPARQRLAAASVSAAVERRLASGIAVTFAAIASDLHVDARTIARRAELRAEVERVAPRVRARWLGVMRSRLEAARCRLEARGARVSRAALAREAGVSDEAVSRWERVTRSTLAVSPCERYRDLVLGAIRSLAASGTRISTVAVCRALGRDRSLIEKRPYLKDLVRQAARAQRRRHVA